MSMAERDNRRQKPSNRRRSGGPGRRGRSPRPQVAVKGRADGYWIYGWHSVFAALANPERHAKRVWATDNARKRLEEHPTLLQRAEAMGLEAATPEMLSRVLSEDAVHQGIAMEVPNLGDSNIELIIHSSAKGPVILLDQVNDPHNVGAILRSAASV